MHAIFLQQKIEEREEKVESWLWNAVFLEVIYNNDLKINIMNDASNYSYINIFNYIKPTGKTFFFWGWN